MTLNEIPSLVEKAEKAQMLKKNIEDYDAAIHTLTDTYALAYPDPSVDLRLDINTSTCDTPIRIVIPGFILTQQAYDSLMNIIREGMRETLDELHEM